MIYVLAYPAFEPSFAQKIADFRAMHEPQRAKLVPPHITLVFGSAETHLEAINERLTTVSEQTPSFSVSFINWEVQFDPFEKKYKIFLVCGEGGDQIITLHNRLYDGPHRAEFNSAHPYKPHMTIATSDTKAEIASVDISLAADLPIKAKLTGLKLVRVVDGRLVEIKTAAFLS